jgi:hypothetical protein
LEVEARRRHAIHGDVGVVENDAVRIAGGVFGICGMPFFRIAVRDGVLLFIDPPGGDTSAAAETVQKHCHDAATSMSIRRRETGLQRAALCWAWPSSTP